MKVHEGRQVQIAPDGCTKYFAPTGPTPDEIADWCHPRRSADADEAWLNDMVSEASNRHEAVDGQSRRLLGVWAHPDDEAYLSAGLMARTTDAGGHVTIVALTDGEDGFPPDDGRTAFVRAQLRRAELREAMALIGVHDVRFLGIPDGQVQEADEKSVVEALVDVIRDVQPDVVVTFGPDGLTGHRDHVANWRLSTRAWLECPQGELWYAAKTTAWLDEWRDLHDRFDVWMTEEPTGVQADELELVVDLAGDELETKRQVLAAHRSQTEGLAAAFGEDRYRRWIRQETFRHPSRADLEAATSGAPLDESLVRADEIGVAA